MDSKEKSNNKKRSSTNEDSAEKKGFPGYPHYPASEDIYSNEEEVDLDPENLIEDKKSDDLMESKTEEDFGEQSDTKDRDKDLINDKFKSDTSKNE